MGRFGAVGSGADMDARPMRSGTVALVLEVSKAVTFASAMPSANYRVFLSHEDIAIGTGIGAGSKTDAGFTLLASVALSGSVAYLAVGD